MAQPGIIVFSAADVDLVPMLADNNTFIGTNTFTQQVVISKATGTSPLSITSTTVNTNLNADLLDGQHGSYYAVFGKKTLVTKTGTYTATTSDDVIICNSTSAFTINLPVASGGGQSYYIKNINTGVITVDGDTSDTIDGETTQTLNQYDCLQIIDYAANKWAIL